jgi:hypothetical protein
MAVPSGTVTAGTRSSTKTLIQPSDLTYQGSWRVPETFNVYGVCAMTIRYVGGARRYLMVEFNGGNACGDIVEFQAPASPTPYVASSVAADLSVDVTSAPLMTETRRWAPADWLDTSWANSTTYPASNGFQPGSIWWDEANGLLWYSLYQPYGSGMNAPIWGAVELLDTVKSGAYCNTGSKYGPWYYRNATWSGGSDFTNSPWCRGQNQLIVPVPTGGQALIGGAKFLVGGGHQGYEADASFGVNLHVVADLTTGMANPVPVVKQLCEYTQASLVPAGDYLNGYACHRTAADSATFIPTNDVTHLLGNGDAPCGPYGGKCKGAVWVDTGTKHGLIEFIDEVNGYVGYWHYNPGTDSFFPTAYDPCYYTGEGLGPKASQHYLGLRIFDPYKFAAVYAGTRGPYGEAVSSGPFAGLPGMTIDTEAVMRSAITNGATIPYTASSYLRTGGSAPAIQVAPYAVSMEDTDHQGAVWDPTTNQIIWVQMRCGPGSEQRPVFSFFLVS